ncbi:MAG TPA: dehydrogenase [Microscillaceae bacterium]|nr:dehydrogenase [Microscillaceae bacterium]
MKTVVVTGANSGLGLYASKHLLQKGFMVILACRNLQKAHQAKKWLLKKTKKQAVIEDQIQIAQLDLASFNSIRKFCKALPTNNLYGIICNAGLTYSTPTRFTQDGVEETFGVNHLGHFLMVNLLLSQAQNLQRIAVVASDAHNPEIQQRFPAPHFDKIEDLAYPNDAQVTDWEKEGSQRYVNSKFCNVLFTYQLEQELKKTHREHVLVNAFNPGFIPGTGLGRNTSPITHFMWFHVLPLFSRFFKAIRTADESGLALAQLISDVKVSGKYFDGIQEKPSSQASYDPVRSQRLWWRSEELAHLKINEQIE